MKILWYAPPFEWKWTPYTSQTERAALRDRVARLAAAKAVDESERNPARRQDMSNDDCDYCAGYRCPCTCESDCGSRQVLGGTSLCPLSPGYPHLINAERLADAAGKAGGESELVWREPAATGTEASDG